MPTYGYQCTICNHTFEVFQRISDEPVTDCPECEGRVRKLLYPVGIVFKGSGFHVTDYRKPGPKDDNSKKATKTEPGPSKEPVEKAEAAK